MASVLAYLDGNTVAKHAKKGIAAGAVLPIDRYVTKESSFAEPLSHGGALYLVTDGEGGEVWVVAVLEAPERSGLRQGDTRKAGWYAPANTTPATNIRSLKKQLALRGELADALDPPIILTEPREKLLREALGESDAPVLGVTEVQAAAPVLKGSPLENAASYLAGGYVAAAIGALAEAWRERRIPALADLIDRANRIAPGYDRPLFDRRIRLFDDSSPLWTQAFDADPIAAMPTLLLNLSIGGYRLLGERAKRLATLPADPRLGRRLAELTPSGPGEFDPQPAYWRVLQDIWLRDLDSRLAASILEAEEAMPKSKTMQRTIDFARGPKSKTKLTAAEAGLVAAIERELDRLEEPLRLEHDLVDAIAAHSDDDAPRLIYADRLQERGHPRGEFIALAVQKERGTLTPALARRFTQLSELPYLSGPIEDLATRRLRPQDRGIDRTLQVSWKTLPITWLEVAAHPLARALEVIELVGNPLAGRADAIAALIGVATKLHRIDAIGVKQGKQVAVRAPGWEMSGDALIRVDPPR